MLRCSRGRTRAGLAWPYPDANEAIGLAGEVLADRLFIGHRQRRWIHELLASGQEPDHGLGVRGRSGQRRRRNSPRSPLLDRPARVAEVIDLNDLGPEPTTVIRHAP